MQRLLRPAAISPAGLALLLASASCLAIAGFDHARLFHRGYAQVDIVGPLFLLNALATAVVIGLLAIRRYGLYVLGAVGISAGSLVSLLLSHSVGFLGFREGGFDSDARLIMATEALATVLALAGAAIDRRGARTVTA